MSLRQDVIETGCYPVSTGNSRLTGDLTCLTFFTLILSISLNFKVARLNMIKMPSGICCDLNFCIKFASNIQTSILTHHAGGRFTPPHTPLHHPPTSLRQPKAPSTGLSASKAMPHHAAVGAMETTEAATISTRLNSSSAHLKAEAGARHRASSNSRARSNREVSGRE